MITDPTLKDVIIDVMENAGGELAVKDLIVESAAPSLVADLLEGLGAGGYITGWTPAVTKTAILVWQKLYQQESEIGLFVSITVWRKITPIKLGKALVLDSQGGAGQATLAYLKPFIADAKPVAKDLVQQIASVWGLSVAKLTDYQIQWGEFAGGSAGNSKTKPAQVVDASNQAGNSKTKPAQVVDASNQASSSKTKPAQVVDASNQAGSSDTKPAQSDDEDDQVAGAKKTLSTGWFIGLGISAIIAGLGLAWAGS